VARQSKRGRRPVAAPLTFVESAVADSIAAALYRRHLAATQATSPDDHRRGEDEMPGRPLPLADVAIDPPTEVVYLRTRDLQRILKIGRSTACRLMRQHGERLGPKLWRMRSSRVAALLHRGAA
jgi:hypothetical protein